MKRKLLLVTTLLLCFCTLIGFCGCGEEEKNDTLEAGKVYTLQEAYEHGGLTKKHLKQIARYNNEAQETSINPCPEVLERAMEETIKEAIAEELRRTLPSLSEEIMAKGVHITTYYGEYAGYHVVLISHSYQFRPTDVPSKWVEIEGVEFHMVGYDEFRAYKSE